MRWSLEAKLITSKIVRTEEISVGGLRVMKKLDM